MSVAMRILTSLFNERTALTHNRAAIAASGDAEALTELDGTIADFQAAEILIGNGYSKRKEMRERLAKWRELLPHIRVAFDRVETLEREFEKAGFEEEHLRDAARTVRDRWQEVCEKKPPESRYPTERELANHAERESAAKQLHSDAYAKAVEARTRVQMILAELISAKENLARLQFQERQLKPSQPQTVEAFARVE